MLKSKKLTKRQLAVIEDLFLTELDEQAVLDKRGVSRSLYERWLADEQFTRQFNERVALAYRRSRVILARYAPCAAAKLAALIQCDEGETTRKACLDIISSHGAASHGMPTQRPPSEGEATGPELSPEEASRLLAALAEVPPVQTSLHTDLSENRLKGLRHGGRER